MTLVMMHVRIECNKLILSEPDNPLSTASTVPAAYEEMLAYEVVNVAYDIKFRPYFSSHPFWEKIGYKIKKCL